jgi:hypothetical protein
LDGAAAVALSDRCIRIVAVAYTLWAVAEILAMNLDASDIGWVMMIRYADIYLVAQAVLDCVRLAFGLGRLVSERSREAAPI